MGNDLEIFRKIRFAIDAAGKGKKTAEMHLQLIKYVRRLEHLSNEEIRKGVGLGKSFRTEVGKMRRIIGRLEHADLNVEKI